MADDKYATYEISAKTRNGERSNGDESEVESGINQAELSKITKTSSVITVLVAGLALFSDGYNAQIIG